MGLFRKSSPVVKRRSNKKEQTLLKYVSGIGSDALYLNHRFSPYTGKSRSHLKGELANIQLVYAEYLGFLSGDQMKCLKLHFQLCCVELCGMDEDSNDIVALSRFPSYTHLSSF